MSFALLGLVGLMAQTPDWAGTWKGSLENHPAREGAKAVEVVMELGEFPVVDGACAVIRNRYFEGGVEKQVKDYKLCRGKGAEDLFVDEGGGLQLKARWMGGVLVTPFKYGKTLLVSTMRLWGEVLEEEILTVEDQAAVEGPLALRARGLQRLTLRRAKK